MKLRFKNLLLFSLVFIFGLNIVNASELNSSDVGKNTYIIGTHMFTRNTNENYNGQLTTKLIMLASKTIEGNTLDDMIIYYKNARGNWIDGISGNVITVPESFEIDYVNLEDNVFTTIYGDVNLDGTVNGKDITYLRRYLSSTEGYTLDNDGKERADVNLDGAIDNKDILVLRRYLAGGYEGYETLPYLGDVEEPAYGDVNLDGTVNGKDITYLRRYLSSTEGYTLDNDGKERADINLDGAIDNKDILVLRRYLAGGYEGYETLPYLGDVEEPAYGDVNLDGTVNGKDITYLRRYLSSTEGYTLDNDGKERADVNLDGAIDNKDILVLRRYLAGGYEGYETLPYLGDVEEPAYGDVNLDGTVNGKDITYLRRYLSSTEGYTLDNDGKERADINLDGAIDNKDILVLRRYLAGGYEGYETLPYLGDVEEPAYGDVNLDGTVNGKDITYLRRYLSSTEGYTLDNDGKERADVNLDGAIDNKDILVLRRYLAGGYEGYETLPYLGDVEEPAYGDVNLDGTVNGKDITYLRRYLSSTEGYTLDNDGKERADVNLDDDIDDIDIFLIKRKILCNDIEFPIETSTKYAITYNLDGGNLLEQNITKYVEEILPYTLNNPEKEGYTFIGWTGEQW